MINVVKFKTSNKKNEEKIIQSVELITPEENLSPNSQKQIDSNIIPCFELDIDSDLVEDDIADTIQISYKNNINILLIHESIRQKFSYENSMLNTYESQIKKLDILIKNTSNINDMRKNTKDKEVLEMKIKNLKSWNIYVEKVKKLLLDYVEINFEKTKNAIIIGKKVENEEEKIKIQTRLTIIDKYITIAGEYICLNISKIEKIIPECPICSTSFKDFKNDEDDAICICPICGWFRENLCKNSFTRESGKINLNIKNDYEDEQNFFKAAIRFACNQTKKFHDNLENDLDEYFINKGYKSGEEIRNQKLNKHGKKDGVGFKLMLQALTDLSKTKEEKYTYRKLYNDYYEDIWLIMHNYWGFAKNNIMYLFPKLKEIYRNTQNEYIQMTSEEKGGRDAAINTQLRLLFQLLACDYKCDLNDFKIPKTRNSLESQQASWKIMCSRTGTKFVPII